MNTNVPCPATRGRNGIRRSGTVEWARTRADFNLADTSVSFKERPSRSPRFNPSDKPPQARDLAGLTLIHALGNGIRRRVTKTRDRLDP